MKTRSAILISVILCGCNVGPKYVAPVIPPPPAFKEALPPAYKGALPGAWQPANPQDAALKGKWWEMFKEPELNTLEERLNIDNQTIAQYFQNFMAARAIVGEARAGYFPTVSAVPAVTRTGVPFAGKSGSSGYTGTSGGTVPVTTGGSGGGITSFTLPFEISWAPDLWGRIGNTVRENQYAAQVSAADLENERLTEQASLATYYFELRGQDALQQVSNQLVEAERDQLKLTRSLVETGIYPPEAIPEAEVSLANSEEAAVGVATNRALYEHAIATLIGKPASSFSLPVKALSTPLPPIPVGVPSELLQRRPDIAAAERTVAEANALIGVEKAAYYPSLSLTGAGGLSGSSLASLFSLPGIFWTLGASASQTLFDAGLRKSTVAQYTAQYNGDVAAYKQTVLTAFQQVEDYIATLRVTSQQINRQDVAIKSAQSYVEMEKGRYETGIDPYLNLIDAQVTLLTNQQTRVTLQVNELAAAVELIQALGGGWNASELPAPTAVTKSTPHPVE
jgi:NodT family efflux transporter outer membrane factor (OMF) lipoprotein